MRQSAILILFILSLSACRDKVICPAFQSTYILDDSVRMAYYSYLWKIDKDERLRYLANQNPPLLDSAGVVVASAAKGTDYFAYVEPYVVDPDEVRKSKYGMVKYEPYWLKNYQMRTAPMENLLAPDPVEQPVIEDVGKFVESDFTDSVAVADTTAIAVAALEEDEFDTLDIPTLAVVEPPKPTTELKYLYRYDPNDKALNVDQAYYNKHFGKYLYTRVPIVEPKEPVADVPADSVSSGGIGAFFKALFSGGARIPIGETIEEDPVVSPPAEIIEEDPNSGF